MKKSSKKAIKQLVKRTLEKYEVSSLSTEALKNILAAEGYTVIRYSAVNMSEQTRHLMEVLGVAEMAAHVDSFTYADRERRVVFIRADVSVEETVKLLALELGRIYCVSDRFDTIVHGTPNEEFEAAEFAYHLLDADRSSLAHNLFKFYPVRGSIFIILLLSAFYSLITVFIVLPLANAHFRELHKDLFEQASAAYREENGLTEMPGANELPTAMTPDNPVITPSGESSSFDTQEPQSTNTDTPAPASPTTTTPTDSGKTNSSQPPVSPTLNPSVPDNSDSNFVVPTDDRVYYATANGKKYHLAGCSYLADKETVEVHQADIDSGKYEPCSRCFKKK